MKLYKYNEKAFELLKRLEFNFCTEKRLELVQNALKKSGNLQRDLELISQLDFIV